MADTRERGDPRTPPIERAPQEPGPDAWTLQSSDRYAQYEAKRNERLYSAYQQAADAELPRMRAAIAEGKARGLPAEQIAQGEEKLKRLQQARNEAARLQAESQKQH